MEDHVGEERKKKKQVDLKKKINNGIPTMRYFFKLFPGAETSDNKQRRNRTSDTPEATSHWAAPLTLSLMMNVALAVLLAGGFYLQRVLLSQSFHEVSII